VKRLTKKTLREIVLEVIDEAKVSINVESTSAWERALKQAKDLDKMKMLSKKDKKTLIRIAKLMKSANEGFSSSVIKKAAKIAEKMSGNMTGATKKIEKLKRGLSEDPKVKLLLRIWNESINKADNGKPFPGKKDDEKKDSEDSKIAVPSDNPYDPEVNDRNELKIPEHKLREFIQDVIRESTKFDHGKVQTMVDNDKYLKRAYKAIRGNDKTKLLRIFTTFILGDPKAERVYKKIK